MNMIKVLSDVGSVFCLGTTSLLLVLAATQAPAQVGNRNIPDSPVCQRCKLDIRGIESPGPSKIVAFHLVHLSPETVASPAWLYVGADSIDVTGRSAVTVPMSGEASDTLSIAVRGDRESEGEIIPSTARFPVVELPDSMAILILPRSFRIPAGAWKGRSVRVRLVDLYGDAAAESSLFRREPPLFWRRDLTPVVIGPSAHQEAILKGLESAEKTVGFDLFSPPLLQDKGDHSPRRGRVEITTLVFGKDDLSSPRVLGHSGIHRECLEAASETCIPGVESGTLVVAWIPNIGIPRISFEHEMMHVLGFGHTCAVDSILGVGTHCPSTSPANSTNRLTMADVAAFWLRQTMAEVMRELHFGMGVDASVRGEFIFDRGQAPPTWVNRLRPERTHQTVGS